MNRLYNLDLKRKEKLTNLQFERYKKELATLRQKPRISPNSRAIAEKKKKDPIFKRTDMVIKQKEENIMKIRQNLETARGESESSPTFKPQLNMSSRRNYERSRTPEEFTAHVYAWHYRKNDNLQRKQYESLQKEFSQLQFKPEINNKSKRLANKVAFSILLFLYNFRRFLRMNRFQTV